MSQNENLLPCLCGGRVEIYDQGYGFDPWKWQCLEGDCRHGGGREPSREAAIALANRHNDPVARIAYLERMIEACKNEIDERSPTPEAPGSEYDKAVEALAAAGLLPPSGWIAQLPGRKREIETCCYGDSSHYSPGQIITPSLSEDLGCWHVPDEVEAYGISGLNIPSAPDWRASLRRIEKGKVTQ